MSDYFMHARIIYVFLMFFKEKRLCISEKYGRLELCKNIRCVKPDGVRKLEAQRV